MVVRSDRTATLDGAPVSWNPPTVLPVTLSGTKWEDHNGNGVRDTGDQGLAGWHILVGGVDRATTDANGNWSVTGLAAGTYTVQEVAQSGWNDTVGAAGYNITAASGTNTGNLNFGGFKGVTLSGFVWEDHNGNGLWETGDIGLAGHHILINGVDRATTDVYGYWSVSNVAAGIYTVQESSQSGWTKTSGASGFTFATTSGVDFGLNFGDFKNVTLGGTKWEDHNGNGVRDTGDQGLAGWHILVNGVDRATTDSSGNWSVANLAPGTYIVQEVAQPNWITTAGTTGYTVTASSGVDNSNLNFGGIANITLSGTKWEDHNGNGVRDTGDQGLAGWHILVNGVDRATTDSSGNWSVTNLAAGSYTVQEVSQSGWTKTSGAAGYSVGLGSANTSSLNFGDFKNINLSGFVWEDHNGDGVWGTGDQGLAGWHILVGGVDRATTDVYGYWSVANLGPGSYTVQKVQQSGWTATAASAGYGFTAASAGDMGLNFGTFKNVTLSGTKWEDHNGNGVQDSGDQGLAGWHILVNGVDRATTDANGNWSVANLAPGTYTVQEVSQSGWTRTSATSGYSLAASSGVNTANLNFGDFNNVSLSGTKWEDHNANGVRDTGDQGLAGWHILINGVDRATTDANGNWSVANLGPGTYSVQEVAQTNWVATYGTSGYSLTASSGVNTGSLDFADFNNTPAPPSTNWFDSHVTDAALRSLGHNLYTDNLIDRNDMISLLRNAEDGSLIDATELADLRAIVANTALFGTLDYVDQLAADVVNASVANAHYQGQTLGNLAANSTAAQMENLINKWFLGLDHPVGSGDEQHVYMYYLQFSGSLFVNGATYDDIRQGFLGDCYFVSTLAETALRNNSAILNMFVDNGDGTYTVKFFNNGQPTYVTVDTYLPTDSAGRAIYAGLRMVYNNAGNELWTALAEKAYVQLNELGWERPGLAGSGTNAYSAISGGYCYAAQSIVNGVGTTAFTWTSSGTSFNAFVSAWNAGKLINFATKAAPASSSIVPNHAYAVVGYNAVNQTITLFNPWGISYGLVTLTWADIQANFDYFDRTT